MDESDTPEVQMETLDLSGGTKAPEKRSFPKRSPAANQDDEISSEEDDEELNGEHIKKKKQEQEKARRESL